MTTLTDREIFNKVRTHLLEQGRVSTYGVTEDEKPQCLYRGPNGLMCAVGCLISDEAYTPDLENKTCGHEDVRKALARSGVEVDYTGPARHTLSLLRRLQDMHDGTEPSEWPVELDGIERHYL